MSITITTLTTIPTPDLNSPAWSLYLNSQSFNLTTLGGSKITLSLSDIDNFIYRKLAQQAIQTFIIAISALLIIILLFFTTTQKARRRIFIFNFLSLLFVCIRSIFDVINNCSQAGYGVGEN